MVWDSSLIMGWCIYMYVCTYTYICIHIKKIWIQGGEDEQDALNCRSLSDKEPQIIGLFCKK